MKGATASDLALLIPELILVGMALALILSARRIQRSPVATFGTVLAALAAALASGLALSEDAKTGFGTPGYSARLDLILFASCRSSSTSGPVT